MDTVFSWKTFFDLEGFQYRDLFESCEYVWQALEKLEAYIRSKPLGKIEARSQDLAYLINPELISIGEGTIVEPGAYIRGPCIIGKNCEIRHGAYIRGNVIIGDRAIVGHTTELKHSILLPHARAAHFAFVGDSILGKDCNLGAGVKCANLRLDGENITVRYHDQSMSTGLRKCGAIIGDACQIGCNTVINPGTLFGKRVHCYPSICVSGFIPEGSLVKNSQQIRILRNR